MDKLHYIKQLFNTNNSRNFMFENSDKDILDYRDQISNFEKYLSTFPLLYQCTFLLCRNMKLPLSNHIRQSKK